MHKLVHGIIISIFMFSNFSFANLICDLNEQSTCTEILNEDDQQLIDQVQKICLQNNQSLQQGNCSNQNLIGTCLFTRPLITFYYAPEYNDYGAEMTCNYSLGKYVRKSKHQIQ